MTIKMRDSLYLLAYALLIFMLSDQSSLLPTPGDFPHKDKLIHIAAYALMAYLAWQAFSHHIQRHTILAIVTVLFTSLYGVSDEFHQSFVAGRDADIWDWLADTMGALLLSLVRYHYSAHRLFSQ
ncbi:MAG: VanZ family protein [Mariprofundaceae bacterium]